MRLSVLLVKGYAALLINRIPTSSTPVLEGDIELYRVTYGHMVTF